MNYTNITGIILAGGKSKRMGVNKALLTLNDKTIIEIIANLMKSIFRDVIIITNKPDEYDFIDIQKYKDIYENRGPLAGIHSGLSNSKTEKNFIISCDIPLMEIEMIKYIVDYKTDKPITVCKADGFIQQLVGLYSKSVLPNIENLLTTHKSEQGEQKRTKSKSAVLSLLDVVPAERIKAEELDIYKKYIFFNMNKPEDYEQIKSILNID